MDIRVENHGSLFLLHPRNRTARLWIEDHVSPDATWWGSDQWRALVVEPRYVQDIVNGARDDGLEVR